jgi:hypothetical protein
MLFQKTIAKFQNFKIFYSLLAVAIVTRFFCDFLNERWRIHSGEIFPIRHIEFFPTYSTSMLCLEWGVTLIGAILFTTNKIRWGALLVSLSYVMSLTQMYQNQKFLILIIMFALAVQPLDLQRANSLRFLKWQMLLIYLFTAVQKIFDQFISGDTLRILFLDVLKINGIANPKLFHGLSVVVIATELSVPLLLLKKPWWGVAVVTGMHLSFAILMPDIWPFTLTMIALSFLFFPPEGGVFRREAASVPKYERSNLILKMKADR